MRAKPARVTEIAAETIDARLLLKVLSDFKKGDFTSRLPSEQTGLTGKIYDALNEVIEINDRMAKEFDRVATVVGKEGRIRQRASLPKISRMRCGASARGNLTARASASASHRNWSPSVRGSWASGARHAPVPERSTPRFTSVA